MDNERKILRYVLAVKGVFGRNRTVKFQTFTLLKEVDPAAPKALDDLMPLVRAKLAVVRLKPGGYFSVNEDPVTLETHTDSTGRPYTIESYMIFSGRKVYEERI